MNTGKEEILRALAHVTVPGQQINVVDAGLISGVTAKGGKAGFLITVSPELREAAEHLRALCVAAVEKLPGIEAVTAVLTAHNAEPIPPREGGPYAQPRERANWNLTPLENVGRVIAVASGKGGVGKSTTAVNLALAMAKTGKRIGLLDADIYGPSLPRMLGLKDSGQPEISAGKMVPPRAYGMPCMSMGFLMPDQAAILRGPMISKALTQMLRSTHWAEKDATLDVLLVDMPPGTGDVHLSLSQAVPLSGAIIVTTPQEVAVMDARKCAQMYVKIGVPILGVIENMSWFADPVGNRHTLFGEGGGAQLAVEFNVPLLGRVPLDMQIRESADRGENFLRIPNEAAAAYHGIAARIP